MHSVVCWSNYLYMVRLGQVHTASYDHMLIVCSCRCLSLLLKNGLGSILWAHRTKSNPTHFSISTGQAVKLFSLCLIWPTFLNASLMILSMAFMVMLIDEDSAYPSHDVELDVPFPVRTTASTKSYSCGDPRWSLWGDGSILLRGKLPPRT